MYSMQQPLLLLTLSSGIAGVGGGFNQLKHTTKRPFSLQDPSISFPYHSDTVTLTTLVCVALVAPGLITLIVSFIFIPGPTAHKSTPKALIWRRKLWEWNTAWLGLGLSLASAFMITEGLKDLAGKPRPHAITVCRPDVSANSITLNRVGGLGIGFTTSGATPIIVSTSICQETDPHVLRDAFASWPSGHSSFSFAGLLYLSLFLCAKFAVYIPLVTSSGQKPDALNTYDFDDSLRRVMGKDSARSSLPPRNSTAAPPIYLLLLAVFLPIGTALFICVSRWFDFHHHGIDILSGAIIGTITAWSSFRFYHMPVRSGNGWSWGSRSRGRAFWVGVGRDGYVGDEGWAAANVARERDLESAGDKDRNVLSAGIEDSEDVPGVQRAAQPENGFSTNGRGPEYVTRHDLVTSSGRQGTY